MNRKDRTLDLVIIGKSILSSYENAQADLYRGLVASLAQLGHRTVFLELEKPGEEKQRDMLRSPYCEVWTYSDTDALLREYSPAIQVADIVLLGSAVVDAPRIAEWMANEANGVKIYYDTDLGRTFNSLEHDNNDGECISCRTIPVFDLYLSTTGGNALERLVKEYGCKRARPLYESVDPYFFYRTDTVKQYDLGFLGQYKPQRAHKLEECLFDPARYTPNRRFVLAGAGYEEVSNYPNNLTYIEYLPEANLVDFYNRQHCTLLLTRHDRLAMGFTPSKRLLAAAACGVPILTDRWAGLDDFFEPLREVYVIEDCHTVLDVLYQTNEMERKHLGSLARERVLAEHTTDRRTQQLLTYWREIAD
ncbi:MAG: glycosyltransferase [Bacteroidota bacterium]